MTFLSYPNMSTSSLAAFLCIVSLLWSNLMIQVENKSFFGIGTRIIGDQLLLKDILQTPPITLTQDPVIKFKYAIAEPITYLEVEADKNVHAKINFSYELNLVEGTISSINTQNDMKPEPFEILIRIYGFNETVLNVNPAYILNRDQQFNGVLKPIQQQHQQQINQSISLIEYEDSKALDNLDLDYDDDDDDDVIEFPGTGDEEDIDYDDDDDFNDNFDKIIEQGQRQEGDFLVYETNQTSATTTELPTNHSVIFYYIDIYYITYIKFIIYEHYLYHASNNYDNTYVVEYAHISPTTLKAIVTDHRTTSLFVQMQMYGFHPTALPVDYKPFLSNGQISGTPKPLSSLTQLKILMNAQQSTTKQQGDDSLEQQQQQRNTIEGLQEQAKELVHPISSNDENKVNCVEQNYSQAGNDCHRIFPLWSTFRLIVTVWGSMMIFV